MLRRKDTNKLQDLYRDIFYKKNQQIDESFLDSLASAEPAEILDPSTAEMRDTEFAKKIEALKTKGKTSNISAFDIAKKTSLKGISSKPAEIPGLGTGKQLTTINAKQLKNQLELTYRTNLETGTAALMVYGASGVGKSDIIRQMAKKFAAVEQREFVYWANANDEMRKKVFEQPKHYYVCSVMNASQLAPEKLGGGIPNMFKDEPRVTERPFEEMAIWMTPGISGMLFLDELNHADADKMNSLFSIVLEKRAGSRKLVDNRMMIVGAGNLGGGHHVTDLPQALVNRVKSFWLVVDPEDWFDWAAENNIDPTILAFVKSAPQHNFRCEHDPKNKTDKNVGFPSPRMFERLSESLGPIYESYENGHFAEEAESHNLSTGENKSPEDMLFEEMYRTAAGFVGEVWTSYWITFIKNYSRFGDLDKLISLDSKQLAAMYKPDSKQNEVEQREVLNVIGGISHFLHNELEKNLLNLGIFQKNKKLEPDFLGKPPSTNLGNTQQEVDEYSKKLKELLAATFSDNKASNLKKTLQALANTVEATKTVDRIGDKGLPVDELLPMLTQRVVAGLSKDQRYIVAQAVTFYSKEDNKLKTLKTILANYIKEIDVSNATK